MVAHPQAGDLHDAAFERGELGHPGAPGLEVVRVSPPREARVVDADAQVGETGREACEAHHVLDGRVDAVNEAEAIELRKAFLPALVVEMVVEAEIAYPAQARVGHVAL